MLKSVRGVTSYLEKSNLKILWGTERGSCSVDVEYFSVVGDDLIRETKLVKTIRLLYFAFLINTVSALRLLKRLLLLCTMLRSRNPNEQTHLLRA